jgi:hypothetical protein
VWGFLKINSNNTMKVTILRVYALVEQNKSYPVVSENGKIIYYKISLYIIVVAFLREVTRVRFFRLETLPAS